MKRISIIIMALLSIVVMSSFVLMETEKRSRSIENLWSEYARAKDKDRIQDMIDILEDIKEYAAKEKSTASYFRACDEYVNAKSRQNWKLTEQLISSTKEELHEYGEPMLEILFGLRHGENTALLLEKINQSTESMKKSNNGGIYDFYPCSSFVTYPKDNDVKFYGLMRKSLTNDYEYIMWMLMSSRGYNCGPACDEFVEYLDGAYPAVPYINYLRLNSNHNRFLPESDEVRKASFEKMAEEYAGRGMGVVAVDELLSMEFDELGEKGTSEEYRMLEKEAEEALAARKALKGDEAAVAEIYFSSGNILVMLEDKDAEIKIEDGDAQVLLRNLDKARFMIKKGGDVVFETEVVNPHESFYKMDTLDIELPALDDGEYKAVVYDGSKEIAHYEYEKFTISIARRQAADGMCVYAADYLTGKPVEKADLLLYDVKGSLISEYKDFIFDGFTPLPKEIYPFRDKKGYRLVCRYEKDGLARMSKPIYMNNRDLVVSSSGSTLWAHVVKDRAAFVPGDTVQFKVFLYEVLSDGSKRAAPEGDDVIVHVKDPEGNLASEIRLVTNEFGSASGSYAIDAKGRNGRWEILVMNGGYATQSSYFTVDEFVLPSYDLSFDSPEKLYFPGDEVKVTGKVTSYSGHGLGGLRALARVTVNYTLVEEKMVEIAPDGSFEVLLVAGKPDDDHVSYGVEMRLSDNTGETLEFNWNSFAAKRINLNATLVNRDSGRFGLSLEDKGEYRGYAGDDGVLSEGVARIRCYVSNRGIEVPDIPVEYEASCEGEVVRSGIIKSGKTLEFDMAGLPSGLYRFGIKAKVLTSAGEEIVAKEDVNILYLPENDKVMPSGVDRVFRTSYKDGSINMQFGSGNGPVWAVVELFGKDYVPLKKTMLYLEGRAGEPGSLETLVFPHPDEYSDKVFLSLFYFKNGERYQFQETFIRPKEENYISLEFSSFVDKALPGQELFLTMKSSPETELLVSVFDAASQKIAFNNWDVLYRSEPVYPVAVSYSYSIGCNKTDGYSALIAYGTGSKSMKTDSRMMTRNTLAYDSLADAVEEEAVPFQTVESGAAFDAVSIRDDFATTLAFEPFLRPSADGTVEMRFRTSDKLSTFIVKAIAHDRSMNTAFAEKEMVVTLPVRVSVVPPKYLYEGDRYVLNASVSNTSAAPLRGKVYLEIYNGEEYLDVQPLAVREAEVDVPAGGSAAVGFEVTVPENVDSLGFKVVFVVHDVLISDGMFVPVPVYPAAQVLTESHSAVLLEGRSADELVARLRDEFVNVSSVGAEYSEISILDMMREALPVAYEPEERDAVSLSAAMYVNFMAASLRKGDDVEVRKCVEAAMNSVSRLLECANSDGGFAWFEGMPSSPIVTAVVLERYAGLSDRRLLDVAQTVWGEDSLDDLDAAMLEAVKYLDASYFGDPERPIWYGRLSLGQYLNLRSMFTGIPLDEAAVRKTVGKKKYNDFRKAVREYLIPKMTMTEGNVLEKVRAIRIINALMDASREGFHMARALGLSSNSDIKKMVRRRDNELISLKQYAVEHPSGGVYYPNAVMPWRGLLESEVYAHAQICNLFRDIADENYGDMALEDIADRICIWLMIQKETQGWASDPGYVEALAAVYDASEAVRNTKIVVLKKKFEKPFDEIKASGNGFTVDVDYYKEGQEGGRIRLAEGDSLNVGDKITAVYSLWSQENRSHVRLSVPRAACLRPVAQLSGWSGGWFRPLSYGHLHVSPYSYREVKADRTLYWIDVFPEEKTAIEEELFVTQEGTFSAPVAEIECLYAPHYRANDSWSSLLEISK